MPSMRAVSNSMLYYHFRNRKLRQALGKVSPVHLPIMKLKTLMANQGVS